MTSTAAEQQQHSTPITPGHVTIADVGGTSVWLYVIALLPGRDVFGVNLGTYFHEVPTAGLSFVTAPVTAGDHSSPLSRLGESLLRALVTFLGTAGIPDPTSTPEAPTAPTSDALEQARREGAAQVQARWDEWNERATRVAHEYADNNSLCSEFDRCMEEIGLEPRGPITYRVTYTIAVPRGTDPWGYDMEDLYNEAEDGTYRPSNVERVD